MKLLGDSPEVAARARGLVCVYRVRDATAASDRRQLRWAVAIDRVDTAGGVPTRVYVAASRQESHPIVDPPLWSIARQKSGPTIKPVETAHL